MPSTSAYLIAAGAAAAALFFILWWMLLSGGDEAPWVPAGLAASVVMLVAVAAREVVMRRTWSRHLLEQSRYEERIRAPQRKASSGGLRSPTAHAAILRTLQKHSSDANAPGALPEAHLEAYRLCQDYLVRNERALTAPTLHAESVLALRTGQERVRALQKHHLLSWAKGTSRALTHEAQQRVRLSDKTETAMRAIDCIDAALKIYPDEPELNESVNAVQEFLVSVKVAHWIELAERSAFKGHYRRAIDRYRDALFYLTRGSVDETMRAATAEKIGREIELLRAKLKTDRNIEKDRELASRGAEEDPKE